MENNIQVMHKVKASIRMIIWLVKMMSQSEETMENMVDMVCLVVYLLSSQTRSRGYQTYI